MKPAFLYVVLALLMNSPLIRAEDQGEMLYEGKTLDQWIKQLQTGGYRSCLDAIDGIGHFGPKASRTTLLLEKIQKEAEFHTFESAVRIALMRIRPEKNVPHLIEMLSPTQIQIERLNAMRDLGYIGPSAASATPELFRIMGNEKDRVIQINAASALGQIGAGGEELLPKLLQNMQEAKDPNRIRDLLMTIAYSGEVAKSAIPDILPLLSHEDPSVRASAVLALRLLDCPRDTLMPVLQEMVQESDPGLRQMAVGGLSHYIPPDVSAIQALIQALQDSQSGVRISAAYTLGTLGEYARPALPALRLLVLQDTDSGLAREAYDAIKQIEYRMPGRE
ncbi:MAG TPA: HEAT repeat domain-containing protein [bacterium]|nr:HEAT repeat domain-containing protein [bacterium]HQO34281.1 HEAT repeat domain-containing protein [bacterium]